MRAGLVRRFVHGTTVATNAVLERKGGKVGLLTTAGFSDVLEIGRSYRRHIYDLAVQASAPVFLAPRHLRQGVVERVSAQGEVVTPLDARIAARRRRRAAGAAGRRDRGRLPLLVSRIRRTSARPRG